MSYDSVMDLLDDNSEENETQSASKAGDSSYNNQDDSYENQKDIDFDCKMNPFSISDFAEELKIISEDTNRSYFEHSKSISAYSVANDCIGKTVYKILGKPVESFSHKWLPIMLRSVLGNAVHDFIQLNTNQFTEKEVTLKAPSINFSGRLDGLIGNNVLNEIKSCTYDDYRKIIKSRKPRKTDFLQAMVYVYMLKFYLTEIKTADIKRRTPPPVLNEYDIDTIQFIYVAHDINCADIDDLGQCLQLAKDIRKEFSSKTNEFCFITSLEVDISSIDVNPIFEYIERKINAINYYINNNKFPTKNDEFVNKKDCFFCLYSNSGVCDLK